MIDNTSLQSTGAAFTGCGSGEADVGELLQFATLIVFSEEIVANWYGINEVSNRTKEVKEQLTTLGLDPTVIHLPFVTQKQFSALCEMAARQCAEDILHAFHPDHQLNGRLYPISLQVQELNTRASLISRLLLEQLSEKDLIACRDEALSMKSAGATAFMVASCLELREAARQSVSLQALPLDIFVDQFDAFCRIYLNTTLASDLSTTYTPAVSRARLLRGNNNTIISQLDSVLNKVVNQVRGASLQVPTIAAHLIQKAKGEPKAILEEAIALRDKTHVLRRRLAHLTAMASSINPEEQFQVTKEMYELIGTLEKELGVKSAPRFRDAIEVSFIFGVPAAKLSGAKLLEWIEHRRKRRKVAVLTHLSKSAAVANKVDIYYERLVRKCSITSLLKS